MTNEQKNILASTLFTQDWEKLFPETTPSVIALMYEAEKEHIQRLKFQLYYQWN